MDFLYPLVSLFTIWHTILAWLVLLTKHAQTLFLFQKWNRLHALQCDLDYSFLVRLRIYFGPSNSPLATFSVFACKPASDNSCHLYNFTVSLKLIPKPEDQAQTKHILKVKKTKSLKPTTYSLFLNNGGLETVVNPEHWKHTGKLYPLISKAKQTNFW
jgi:hypothetical protein